MRSNSFMVFNYFSALKKTPNQSSDQTLSNFDSQNGVCLYSIKSGIKTRLLYKGLDMKLFKGYTLKNFDLKSERMLPIDNITKR